MEYRKLYMSNTSRYSRLQMCGMDWSKRISKEGRGLWLAALDQEGFIENRPVWELLAIELEKQECGVFFKCEKCRRMVNK